MKYLAVIADIIKSREILNREDFQLKLTNKLEQLNNSSKNIISPYTITLGDEFQSVYKSADGLLEDFYEILIELYPVKIRFSVGLDLISTNLKTNTSLGMDGPAFYKAREGIETLKNKKISLVQFFSSQTDELDLINKSLILMNSIMNNWKYNSLFIFNELLNTNQIPKIANSLEISTRGVYKTITTNNIKEFVRMHQMIENYLIKEINRE